MKDQPPLAYLWRLVIHVAAGLVAAAAIAGAAIAMHLGAKWIDSHGLLQPGFVTTIYLLEYLLFILDAICLVFFLIAEAFSFLRAVAGRER